MRSLQLQVQRREANRQARRPHSGRAGFTLAELMIVGAIIGIATALALPSVDSLFSAQELRDAARSVSAALSEARGEAVRTGNIYLVFVEEDAEGDPLLDSDGNAVDVQIVDDGRPGSLNQNCQIDAGEVTGSLSLEGNVSLGVTSASAKVATDTGDGTLASGITFADVDGDPASWVLFRPEGTALAFSDDCTTGAIGSGGGGVYLTDGDRDSAVVVTPLGSTRIHSWSGAWTH